MTDVHEESDTRWFHSFPQLGIAGERPLQSWIESLLPEHFEGSVLDVGTASGYFAFLAAQRGAQRVVAMDAPNAPSHFTEQFKEVRGRLSLEDKVSYELRSVYEIEEDFDTILFLGVFYHLRHPALALDVLADHCKVCWLETGFVKGGTGSFLNYYAGNGEGANLDDRDSVANWWYEPTLDALSLLVRDSGFTVEGNALFLAGKRVMCKLVKV